MKHIVLLVLMIGVPVVVSAQDSDAFLGLDVAGGWVSGGGVQIDYVRRDLPGVDKNEVRATIGAVLPMCLRNCRDYAIDGLRFPS